MSRCIGYSISYRMQDSPGVIKENIYTTDFTAAKRSIQGRGGQVLNYSPIFG